MHGHLRSHLVVVQVVYIEYVTIFESKRHSPIAGYRYRIVTGKIAS